MLKASFFIRWSTFDCQLSCLLLKTGRGLRNVVDLLPSRWMNASVVIKNRRISSEAVYMHSISTHLWPWQILRHESQKKLCFLIRRRQKSIIEKDTSFGLVHSHSGVKIYQKRKQSSRRPGNFCLKFFIKGKHFVISGLKKMISIKTKPQFDRVAEWWSQDWRSFL